MHTESTEDWISRRNLGLVEAFQVAEGIFDVRPSIPQGWPLYYYMNNVARRPKALNEFARA